MAPTNVKTVHQTSLHIERNLDPLGLLSPTHGQRSQQQIAQIALQSVLPTIPSFSRPHIMQKYENCNKGVHGDGGLKLAKQVREPASSRPKPFVSLKNLRNLARSPLLVSPRRKKQALVRDQLSPSKTSQFAPLILAHKDSALAWLVGDEDALRPCRIWCLLTR